MRTKGCRVDRFLGVAVLACLGALITLAGCGSGTSKAASKATTTSAASTTTLGSYTTDTTAAGATVTTAAKTTATTRAPTVTTQPRTTTTISAGSVVTATDAISSITVARGQTLRVVVSSTYYTFEPTSNPAVLSLQGTPIKAPAQSCFPAGAGCGTVTAMYSAVAAGQSTVVATRTTCGEAVVCTPAQRRYALTVTVK